MYSLLYSPLMYKVPIKSLIQTIQRKKNTKFTLFVYFRLMQFYQKTIFNVQKYIQYSKVYFI